jgi:hypothetical protein
MGFARAQLLHVALALAEIRLLKEKHPNRQQSY